MKHCLCYEVIPNVVHTILQELSYMYYNIHIPYSANLSREKTFMNFAVLEPPVKVFSTKCGHAVPTYDRI